MAMATFFGHRDKNYFGYRDKIQAIMKELIEKRDVRVFFNGFRGNFDKLCAEILFELKAIYPEIKNILVLSYHCQNMVLPKYFDESIYLLEKCIPPRYAILYTNREMILRADYIISGVCRHYGGAFAACEFARRKEKNILDIFKK